MAYTELVNKAQQYFPNLEIKYKDQSLFMKIIGKIMFFNPAFMTSYLTTFGDTVYVPSQQFETQKEFLDVFIHECTHMYDEKRLSFLYTLSYIFPQILSIIFFLLSFLITWKIMVPLGLLCLAPLPAPWRTYFEKRAYLVQMYARYKLFGEDPSLYVDHYAAYFSGASYYFMWIFGETKSIAQEALNIKAGNPACASEPALLQQVNDLIAAAKV